MYREGSRLKVGKFSRLCVLHRVNKIYIQNKHEQNRPKIVPPAVFAGFNCRRFPVDLTSRLLFLDFNFGDFDVDVRLRKTARRSNYLSDHAVISHCYKEWSFHSCKEEDELQKCPTQEFKWYSGRIIILCASIMRIWI